MMKWIRTKTDVKQVFAGEDIYLKDLFLVFWERKLYPLILGVFCLIIGVIAHVTSKDTYLASSTMLSERSAAAGGGINTNLRGFSRILGMGAAGNNPIIGSTDFEDPAMYSTLLYSTPFMLELIEESFYFPMYQDSLKLKEFFVRYDDKNLVSKIFSAIKSGITAPVRWLQPKKENKKNKVLFREDIPKESAITNLAKDSTIITTYGSEEGKAIDQLKSRIAVEVSGAFININTEMPTALLSAQLNEVVFEKLIEYATLRQTAKERRDLVLVEERTALARARFEAKQKEFAIYQDKNRGVISQLARIEEQRIKYEYDLLFNIYNNVAIELEKKKLELEENTPLYTVFEPIYIPINPQSTSKKQILLFLAAGIFLGFALIVVDIILAFRSQNG